MVGYAGRVSNISKREAVDRLLRVWEANPKLRLGQLLENATHDVSISYLFDDELVGLLELYLPPTKPKLLRTAGG